MGIHKLVGYDRETEQVIVEYVVPENQLERVHDLMEVDPRDPSATGSYPLHESQVHDIALIAGQSNPPMDLDYFLETFAAEGAGS